MNKLIKADFTVKASELAAHGYSIYAAACAAGCTASHLVEVCKGNRRPSADLVARLNALPKRRAVKCRVSY